MLQSLEETDLSDVASGVSHRPVLRGTSAKDVHWYVAWAYLSEPWNLCL